MDHIEARSCRLPESHDRRRLWRASLETDDDKAEGETFAETTPENLPEKRQFADGTDFLELHDLSPHPDEAQVLLDVKRLFALLSQFHVNGNSSYATILSGDEVKAMRRKLYFLVVQVLRKYPSLHYYQGYHDIASVVLLVCENDEEAFRLLELLTLRHLRDYMVRDISLTLSHLKLIPAILEKADPRLFEVIRSTSPSFVGLDGVYYDYKFLPALLCILTLFSHDLGNLAHITALWDFVFSYRSVAVGAYFYAASLLHFKETILEKLGKETDLDTLHSLISPATLYAELTEGDLTLIIELTSTLILRYPPDNLPSKTFDVWFEEFNTKSVLMTTSNLAGPVDLALDPQSLKLLLEDQETQLARLSAHESLELQNAMESADSLASSGELDKLGVFSSYASSSVSSLANSAILKKIFVSGNHKPSRPHSSIFKLSLYVGVVGLMVHFMLKQGGWYKIPRMMSNNLEKSLSYAEINRVATVLADLYSNVKDTLARESIDIPLVGLGSIRRHIYALGNLT